MVEAIIPAAVVKTERNDCVVRAFAAALDTDYGRAHRLCRDSGRRTQRGHFVALAVKHINAAWKAGIRVVKLPERITLAQFAERHPTGKFVVTVRGHALAVIDGQPSDDTRTGMWLRSAHKL